MTIRKRALISSMLPQVLDQQFVHFFKYWQDGIRTGMRHQSELYALVRSYTRHERLQAYELGCDLAMKNNQIRITCSPDGYTIWASLTSSFIAATRQTAQASETIQASAEPELAYSV